MTETIEAPASWRNRIVATGEEAPDQLLANPANWRIHPKAQQDALASVLDGVGWVGSVLVNQRTGHVVDGHLRVSLALSRGEPTVPVAYVDLSIEEEKLILASLDPLAAMAGTDDAKLRELLEEVSIPNSELEARLVSFLAKGHRTSEDADDVPEPPEEPYVKAGDLWLLGRHRILCGDATKAEDVGRLLDGAKPSLMITDPPYGVSYDPSWRSTYKKSTGESIAGYSLGTVFNDDRADWTPAWALSPATAAYVWHGGLHAGTAANALTAAGFELRAQIIWVKQRGIFGRGAYHWQHEPCYYAVRRGETADWIGKAGEPTVWEINTLGGYLQAGAEDAPTEHSTQKPVECMSRPMRNHSGNVYEPFSGSGTTLIAAEQLGRICYAMELEPRYVQVAIERWTKFTGREAVRG